MTVKLKPVNVIKADLGIEPNGEVHKYFQNQCYEYMDKYVPQREGHLRYENVDLSNPRYIIYCQPYANYQYHGIREDGTHKVENYTTDGTGPYWDKQMVSAEFDDLIEKVKEYMQSRGIK